MGGWFSSKKSQPRRLRCVPYSSSSSDLQEKPEALQPPPGEFSQTQCEQLVTELQHHPFAISELDLSRNSLNASVAETLLAELEETLYGVNILRLSDCVLTERCLTSLVSILKSQHFILKELDLSGNKHLMDAGVKLLSEALKRKFTSLKTLKLVGCELTESSCASLGSALTHNDRLEELDLSENCLRDSGVDLLCAGLSSSTNSLKSLRLSSCELTEKSCEYVALVMDSPNSILKEVDLSLNELKDEGIKMLSDGLKSPKCNLRTLRLKSCLISDEGFASLVSALTSEPSVLTELDLSGNELQERGKSLMYELLQSPNCELEILRLESGQILKTGHRSRAAYLDDSERTDRRRARGISHASRKKHLGERMLLTRDVDPNLKHHDDNTEGSKGRRGLSRSSRVKPQLSSHQGPTCRPVCGEGFLQRRNVRSLSSHRLKEAEHGPFKLNQFQKAQAPVFKSSVLNVLTGKPKRHFGSSSDASGPHVPLDPNPANTEPSLLVEKIRVMKVSEAAAVGDGQTADDSLWRNRVVVIQGVGSLPPTTPIPTRFTPGVLTSPSGVTSYMFRVQLPGTYQCDLTRLVFRMTQGGGLSYGIVQWDELLLQSAGKTPAGPLYDVQCSEDAVSQLHLPHCETRPALTTDGLSVVHIGDDGMKVLQPLEITDTHVVVDVPHLSAFGLVWDLIKTVLHRPIRGQVLLFERMRKKRKLNVFLLPENIPLMEVKRQQEGAEYIESPSCCLLNRGQTYSLRCHESDRVQPESSLFDVTYGPNYHPTFEVQLRSSSEEAAVTILDQEKTVWNYHADFMDLRSASSSVPPPPTEPDSLHVQADGGVSASRSLSAEPAGGGIPQRKEEKKLFSVRIKFINGVSSSILNDLLDNLLENRVINPGEMDSIQAFASRADKARELVDMVRRKGNEACGILICSLCELDPFLSETLQLK